MATPSELRGLERNNPGGLLQVKERKTKRNFQT
ncbi:hypothetical protein PC117_g24397 [Phytophthora cactorum]|uniref:Uncharacterized protein n=1 Tax=Phytophthora cactorum TaxID=29920 RepID=A0A8T1AWU6_9STRA|nr:hypothetical protein PC117_g24397 [Phytophthora cactorum]